MFSAYAWCYKNTPKIICSLILRSQCIALSLHTILVHAGLHCTHVSVQMHVRVHIHPETIQFSTFIFLVFCFVLSRSTSKTSVTSGLSTIQMFPKWFAPPQPFCRWNSAFNEHTGPRLAYVYNPNHFNCENFERQYIIFIFADGRVSIHRFRYIIRCIGMLRVSIFFFRFFHICYATAAECFWNISCRDIIQKRHAFHITDVCYFHCCCCCWKWVESTEITSHRFSLFVCLSSLLVGGCQCSAIIHASFYHVEQSFISVFCLIKKERPREWRNENRERKYDFCHRRLQVSPTLLARRATKKCIRTGSRGLQRQQKRMYVSLSSFLSLSLAASLKSNWSGRISLCAQNI